jgi:hypothetical protein
LNLLKNFNINNFIAATDAAQGLAKGYMKEVAWREIPLQIKPLE